MLPVVGGGEAGRDLQCLRPRGQEVEEATEEEHEELEPRGGLQVGYWGCGLQQQGLCQEEEAGSRHSL